MENLQKIRSVLGNDIRLVAERWAHIIESHDYLAGYMDMVIEILATPDLVVQAITGEHYALKAYAKTHISQKTGVVVYRDKSDGFVITALLTSRPHQFIKRGSVIWKK